MKKIKLFLGILLLLSLFSLASCDLENTDSGSVTPNISDNTGDTPQDNTTYYTVKFNTNSGSSISSQRVEDGKTASKPSDPTKTGYSFVGWYIDEAGNNEYDFNANVTSNITIYAKWSIESYTISFELNGGNEIIEDQKIEYKGTISKPADPTKDGYIFGGWYTSTSYFFEFDFSSKITKSLTLYAKWNEIPKTVKYEVGASTIDTWTDSIGSKWMKIAVPVTNTGTADLYLDDISVDIESSTGSLLETKSMINGYPEYLKPGETGYYYTATSRSFSETNVKVVPNINVEKATNDVIRYNISDVSITTDQIYGVKVIGRVENNTREKGSLVEVVVLLFDANGKLICNANTYLLNGLEVGEKVGFSVTPFAFRYFTPEDVASYEVYAYPYQFNW